MATQSPYVADSGSVGELGQPTHRDNNRGEGHFTDHPSQAPGERGLAPEQGKDRGFREPGGLHVGGKETGAYGDTESIHPEAGESQSVGTKVGGQRTDHPLMATHDTNIPHGHEPMTSEYGAPGVSPTAGGQHQKRGVGGKLKNAAKGLKDCIGGHKEKQQGEHSPGLTGKVNNAVTGQYPGQGTATGNATAGAEEDYGVRSGVGQEHLNRKNENLQHGRGDAQHETGWPKPVPPPGIHNPTLTGAQHYSPNADQTPAQHHAPKYDQQTPTQGYAPKYDQQTPTQGYAPKYDQERNDAVLSGTSAAPTEGGAPLSGHAPGTGLGRADERSNFHDTSATHSSTPAEPNVKHDVPSADNTGGQYTDSAGNVQHEGPRDDNVKKEGFMSKVMDKLNLGSHDKQKQTTA